MPPLRAFGLFGAVLVMPPLALVAVLLLGGIRSLGATDVREAFRND